ncbi:MAG: ZIP family metal transporter [Clostridia bacterium]|nr:ZIP family metal transporter [Clostridia bacterium]
MLILSALAGVLGTGIGGVIGASIKDRSAEAVGKMLMFAAGIMLGVVAFEMMPEAVKNCKISGKEFLGEAISMTALLLGALLAFLLNFAVEKAGKKQQNMPLEHQKQAHVEVLAKREQKSLKKAGIITFLAIAFHNIPEGMAIGASGAVNIAMGIVVAVVIALHNLPEGMAISAPLVSGGVRPSRAILLSLLAGGATLFGAVIGVFVGGANLIADGACVALAAGAMIYVSIFDLMPVATKLQKGDFSGKSFFFGFVVAMIFSLLF